MAVTARERAQKVLSAMSRAVARWRRRGAGTSTAPDAAAEDPLADWFAKVRRGAPQLLEPGPPNRAPGPAPRRSQNTPGAAPTPPPVPPSSGAVPDEWRGTAHHSEGNAPLDVVGAAAPEVVPSRAAGPRTVGSRPVEPGGAPDEHSGRRLPDRWRNVLHRAASRTRLRIPTPARPSDPADPSRASEVAMHDAPYVPAPQSQEQAVHRPSSAPRPAWPVLTTIPERPQPPARPANSAAEQRSVLVFAAPPTTPPSREQRTRAIKAARPDGTRRFPAFDVTAPTPPMAGPAEPAWPDWPSTPGTPAAEPAAAADDPWPPLPPASDFDTTVASGPDVEHLRALRREHEVWH